MLVIKKKKNAVNKFKNPISKLKYFFSQEILTRASDF